MKDTNSIRETAINLFLILLVTLGCVRVSQVLTFRCDTLTEDVEGLRKKLRRLEKTPAMITWEELKERLVDLEYANAWRKPVSTLRKAFFQGNAQYLVFESYNRWSQAWRLGLNSHEELRTWKTKLAEQGLQSDIVTTESGEELSGSL